MGADTLSDLLRAVRLRGAFFYDVEARPPWVAEAPASRELIPAVMPGVEHMIEFHAVVRGDCWAALVGEPPIRLAEGDVVLFPQGDAHVMSSAPGMRARRVEPGFAFSPRPSRLPYAIAVDAEGVTTARLDGGGRSESTVVCGFLGCDARPFNPLLAALPRVLTLRGAAGPDSWVARLLRTVVDESSQRRPGGEAVLERMSEMLFVEALRRYVDGLPPEGRGWFAGLRDPVVGRALALLHARPADPWTAEALAAEVHVSRSTLHERFAALLDLPPMQYLLRWRMQLASRMLRDTGAKLVRVALEVGYDSESAFSRAFKRVVGASPGAWRARDDAAPAPPT